MYQSRVLSSPMLYHRDVPIQGALESLFIEQDGMQCLRQAANVIERRLCDLPHFLQVLAKRCTLRHLFFHAAQ